MKKFETLMTLGWHLGGVGSAFITILILCIFVGVKTPGGASTGL